MFITAPRSEEGKQNPSQLMEEEVAHQSDCGPGLGGIESCFGFLATRHVGSYLPDQGLNLYPLPSIGRWSLNHWTTTEGPPK